MKVLVIDYGSGNLRSAAKALERAAQEAESGHEVVVGGDARLVEDAAHLVLPGVGAFADCLRGLAAIPGMVDALARAVLADGRPFLGICVGMQLLATRGHEHGAHEGLGWLPGEVVPLTPADGALKVPHMGWNELEPVAGRGHPALAGIARGAHAYFVHSYHFRCAQPEHVLATVDYGGPVAAIVGRDNILGTQFHPEKSQRTGLRLLGNFLRWRP